MPSIWPRRAIWSDPAQHMISANDFLAAASARGFDFYCGVPCSFLTPLINRVISDPKLNYVGAASEGEAVAIAAGAWLAGRKSVAMCQNSGLGNMINPLTSLNWPFRIPGLVIVTWRGQPGLKDDGVATLLLGREKQERKSALEIRRRPDWLAGHRRRRFGDSGRGPARRPGTAQSAPNPKSLGQRSHMRRKKRGCGSPGRVKRFGDHESGRALPARSRHMNDGAILKGDIEPLDKPLHPAQAGSLDADAARIDPGPPAFFGKRRQRVQENFDSPVTLRRRGLFLIEEYRR